MIALRMEKLTRVPRNKNEIEKGGVELTMSTEEAAKELVDDDLASFHSNEAHGEAQDGVFATVARFIFRKAPFFVAFMPVVCLLLGVYGLLNYEVEESVNNIWSLSKGDYHKDSLYKEGVYKGNDASSLLTISKPRHGGNVLTSDHLAEIASRLSTTQEVTVTHKGVAYGLDDVCLNAVGPYVYPCFRVNSLDCFREGNYDWDPTAAAAWRASVGAASVAWAKAGAPSTLLASTVCNPECVSTGTTLKNDFADDADCAGCLLSYTSNNGTQRDQNAFAALRSGAVASGTAAAKASYVHAAIALRAGTGSGAQGGCVVGASMGSLSDGSAGAACTYDTANVFLADGTCQTCYLSVYGAMTAAQINTEYYATANALAATGGLCTDLDCRDADGDLYVENLVTTTVNAHSDDFLKANVATQTAEYTEGVTTAETTYSHIGIARRDGTGSTGNSGCSSTGGTYALACTFSSDLAFLADPPCVSCLNDVFALMDANQKTTALVAATSALLGLTTEAAADTYIAATVLESVMAGYANTFVATGLCSATYAGDQGADYGPCDMTGAWSSDATCVACFEEYKGANKGTATQATYQLYAGLRTQLTVAGVATTKTQTIYSGLAGSSTVCSASCATFDASVSYAASVVAGSWAADATCSACFLAAYEALTQAQINEAYYATGLASLTAVGLCASVECRNNDLDTYVESQVSLVVNGYSTGQLDAALTKAVNGALSDKTPYTYQVNKGGEARFVSTGASEQGILAAASDTCYAWDEGQGYPAASKPITFGGSTPGSVDVSATNPLEIVKAFQVVFRIIAPSDIVARVALAVRPGGPLEISENDAEEIMYKMKEKFEDAFTKGWDDEEDGDVQFSAFSDDVGVVGSFGRTLEEFTTDSAPLSAYSYAALLVLSTLLLTSFNHPVRSQGSLGFVGAFMVVLAFLGAIGLSVFSGIALNVVQTWTLPFLMVGIGVDDMFILALAARGSVAKRGGEADEEAFVEAFVEVATPVTLTSLVNSAMFVVMLFSDIPAVFLTAETALYAIILMYFTIITSFSAAVAIDFKRQRANRLDVMCCKTADTEQGGGDKADEAGEEPNLLWTLLYVPVMTSPACHALISLLTLVLLGFGGYGLSTTKLGLGLSNFFPQGSQGANFAANQDEYFPVWPAAVNWGQEKYHTAQVQMLLVKQFESVTADKHVTDLDSTYVWTATLAEWALPGSYGVGTYCSSSNALTSGNCGPALDSSCTASWSENTLELKLKANGGMCQQGSAVGLDASKSFCPTLELTEAQYAHCTALCGANTNLFAALGPGFNTEADGYTPELPIKYSQASGSSLYVYDLFEAEDYVDAIEGTRKGCDDDQTKEAPRCWVSGIAFDYWEQYLTIEEWVLNLCAIIVAISFAAAALFFWANFGFGKKTFPPALLGGSVVALTSAATLLTVTGFSALSGVTLCGLSAMACIMSAGFGVEYSVHVVHRFLAGGARAPQDPYERALHIMDGLFVPTSMAFVTSAVGIAFLTLSQFAFVHVYFFTPLVTVLLVTYFFGVFTLPVVLSRAGGLDLFQLEDQEEKGGGDKRGRFQKGVSM